MRLRWSRRPASREPIRLARANRAPPFLTLTRRPTEPLQREPELLIVLRFTH